MPAGVCTIFWDNSNIFIPAKDEACDKEGPTAGRDLRINFQNLYDIARAGRQVSKAYAVGSQPPELKVVWQQLRKSGVTLELYERGEDSGKEQAVDQALQVHMLRTLVDQPPGVAVLLTGDGSGFHNGVGFHADLARMHDKGWGIEVLSWTRSCHPNLKAWAEKVGTFVPLEKYYESVTFIKGIRNSKLAMRRPPTSKQSPTVS